MPVKAKDCSLTSCVAFTCHVSLVPFNLEQFFNLLTFMTLILLTNTGQIFCRAPSFGRYLIVPHEQIRVLPLQQEADGNAAEFSWHALQSHMVWPCHIVGDLLFDHLIKWC